MSGLFAVVLALTLAGSATYLIRQWNKWRQE